MIFGVVATFGMMIECSLYNFVECNLEHNFDFVEHDFCFGVLFATFVLICVSLRVVLALDGPVFD